MKLLDATLALACLSTAVATAQEPPQVQNRSQDIDTQKFCVYAGRLYSIGALIEVGEAVLECRMQPSTSELLEAGARWATVYSEAESG